MAHLSQAGEKGWFPLMLMGIWRARACRITYVRGDHRRAPVYPLAESWVSPGVRAGYLGMH